MVSSRSGRRLFHACCHCPFTLLIRCSAPARRLWGLKKMGVRLGTVAAARAPPNRPNPLAELLVK